MPSINKFAIIEINYKSKLGTVWETSFESE
jgi:hypothetical protein